MIPVSNRGVQAAYVQGRSSQGQRSRQLSPTPVAATPALRPGLAYYAASPCAADRSVSPENRTIVGMQVRNSSNSPEMRRSPVAYSVDKYRAMSPSPSTQGLGVVRPTEPVLQHVRDRSSSPTANARFAPAPLVPPFVLQGRVPVRQVRAMTPDSRDLLKRTAPLPVPVPATSNSNRMLREQNITTRSNGSDRRLEPPSIPMVLTGATGRGPAGAPAAAMVDRSRTISRSLSPMVQVPLEQYYSRSRPATPFGRSLSPSGHSSTPTHADPRAPSPCRILTTKTGRQAQVLRPQILTGQPSAEGAKQFVTYRQSPGVVQGDRISAPAVARAQVRVRQPSPQIQGSQSNTSTIASMQAMSVYSGSQASPPIPGSDCAPQALAPGGGYLPCAPTGVGTSPSGAPLPPSADLCEGAVLPISGGTCRVKKPLGMGSFGAVWEAEQTGGGPALALKEILCHSQVDLINAQFEGSLLESFKGKEPGKGDSADILPVLVGHDMTPLSHETYRVRLAMTRLPGEPLDTFLRVRQDEQQLPDRSAGSRMEMMNEAFHFASELLQQLAPAFEEHIAALAYHRDVNAHNILIDFSNGSNPKYGLVDFGLAVDVQSWQGELDLQDRAQPSRQTRVGQDGATTWHHLDVGGDCRYWPVSAWVQFLLGWTELDCNPMLRSEYRTRLDMHSLGLTALQVLVETMPPDVSLPPGHSAGGLFAELQSLKSGWERYWAMVTPLHSRLMETFHNGGDWDVLKAHCLDNRVHEAIASELRGIRASIIRALAAGRSLPSRAGFQPAAVGLLTALLLLIGCGDRSHEVEGTVGPNAKEVPGPVVWRQVRVSLLEKDGLSPTSPGKPSRNVGRGERRPDARSPASAPNRSAGLSGTDMTSGPGRTNQSNGDAHKRTLGAGDIPSQTMLEKVDWMIANEFPR